MRERKKQTNKNKERKKEWQKNWRKEGRKKKERKVVDQYNGCHANDSTLDFKNKREEGEIKRKKKESKEKNCEDIIWFSM